MMTTACDLQVLILLLLFSIPNPFQGNKKTLEKSCSRNMCGPLLETRQLELRLFWPMREVKLMSLLQAAKTQEMCMKPGSGTRRRYLVRLTGGTNFSLGFSCISLAGTFYAQLLYLLLTSFTDCNANILKSS